MDTSEYTASLAEFPGSPLLDMTAEAPNPQTLGFDALDDLPDIVVPDALPERAWPTAGKTLPKGHGDYGSSSDDESDTPSGNLEDEVARLRAELDAIRQPRKKRRRTVKAGSPQIRYLMRTLQGSYDIHANQLKTHSNSPGQEARALLVHLLGNFMDQLNEESESKGYDWQSVPDRPHAKEMEFFAVNCH